MGLHKHIRDLRTLFKDPVKFYNNKEAGLEINKHYPFENYQVLNAPVFESFIGAYLN